MSIYLEKVRQPEQPHKKDGAEDSVFLPATAGGEHPMPQTQG